MSKFIDFHTHKNYSDNDVLYIRSLLLKETPDYNLNYFFTIGCHPWYADKYNTYKDKLLSLCQINTNCLAVGEIGIDRTHGNLSLQEDVFIDQLNLAEKFNKPVVIHCVRAYDMLLKIRKKFSSQTWIVHGFNGNVELAKQLINHRIFISIGKSILIKNSKVRKSFKSLPLDFIFLETDVAQIHIKDVYFAASEILEISVEELQGIIIQNFKQVFNVQVE